MVARFLSTRRVLFLIFVVPIFALIYTLVYWNAGGSNYMFKKATVVDMVKHSSHNQFIEAKTTLVKSRRFNVSQPIKAPTCFIPSIFSDTFKGLFTSSDEVCVKQFVQRYRDYCEKSLRPSASNLQDYVETSETGTLPCLCPCINAKEHIILKITYEVLKTNELESKYASVQSSRWFPTWCTPRHRIAIIIPFADRYDHLNIFLNNMIPFLQNQLVDYTIFVIEQVKPELFNRAALMNIGFVEASSRGNFDCFIFHDVDQIPIDNINYYVCSATARHMCAFREKLKYVIAYHSHFGGVNAFPAKDFKFVNGFSNRFYGWGGEDDDLRHRVDTKRVRLADRWPVCMAKYHMIPHEREKRSPMGALKANPQKYYKPQDMDIDGLNTLSYTILEFVPHQLYTMISVNLPPPPSYDGSPDLPQAPPQVPQDLPKGVPSLLQRRRDIPRT